MTERQTCYHVVLHFRDYRQAKALVDAQESSLSDDYVWKIELRIVKE